MSDSYELDIDDGTESERPTDGNGRTDPAGPEGAGAERDPAGTEDPGAERDPAGAGDAGAERDPAGGPADGDSVGVPIPDEHVGAFVAQAFEDPERDTDWADVVDELVASGAREAWDALDPTEQVAEVLRAAADYDRRAIDHLDDITTDTGSLSASEEHHWQEATRLRRNADTLRDGIADAYATGHVDDEGLVTAIETVEFDTGRIARREERLETVANAFGLDFRPYGGTLFATEEDRETTEEFTAWDR